MTEVRSSKVTAPFGPISVHIIVVELSGDTKSYLRLAAQQLFLKETMDIPAKGQGVKSCEKSFNCKFAAEEACKVLEPRLMCLQMRTCGVESRLTIL